MSICIYAFLGPRTEDLDVRCLQAFSDLGFKVQLHPESSFAVPPAGGALYLSILKTPARLQRIAPDQALLTCFDYYIEKHDSKAPRSKEWPPRKVKQYGYEVNSRTASGRSTASYFMQALSMAILARETGGWYFCEFDDHALSGESAVAGILQELEPYAARAFDDEAYPFTAWPPLAGDPGFAWPQPIGRPAPPAPAAPRKQRWRWRYRFSIFHLPGIVLLLYWLALGLISAFTP